MQTSEAWYQSWYNRFGHFQRLYAKHTTVGSTSAVGLRGCLVCDFGLTIVVSLTFFTQVFRAVFVPCIFQPYFLTLPHFSHSRFQSPPPRYTAISIRLQTACDGCGIGLCHDRVSIRSWHRPIAYRASIGYTVAKVTKIPSDIWSRLAAARGATKNPTLV